MRILILLTLISCAHRKPLVVPKKEDNHFYTKVQECMTKFSYHGFDADGIVKICKEVFNRRK